MWFPVSGQGRRRLLESGTAIIVGVHRVPTARGGREREGADPFS